MPQNFAQMDKEQAEGQLEKESKEKKLIEGERTAQRQENTEEGRRTGKTAMALF